MEFKFNDSQRVCKLCGKQFVPKCACNKYCSRACADAREKQRQRERMIRNDKARGIDRPSPDARFRAPNTNHPTRVVCVCCGNPFITRRPTQIFCSCQCKSIFAGLTPQMKAERRARVAARVAMMERLAARDAEYARLFPEQAKRRECNVEVSHGSVVDAEIIRRFA